MLSVLVLLLRFLDALGEVASLAGKISLSIVGFVCREIAVGFHAIKLFLQPFLLFWIFRLGNHASQLGHLRFVVGHQLLRFLKTLFGFLGFRAEDRRMLFRFVQSRVVGKVHFIVSQSKCFFGQRELLFRDGQRCEQLRALQRSLIDKRRAAGRVLTFSRGRRKFRRLRSAEQPVGRRAEQDHQNDSGNFLRCLHRSKSRISF